MIPKHLDNLQKDDVDILISNESPESRVLEYKEQLPGNSDGDKKEFLADVTSFANAGGGDLIYGVKEKRDADGKTTGMPESAPGLASINVDEVKRRLDDIVRNGVAPRIPQIQIKDIPGFALGPVVILRVPKSWAAPHMVTLKGDSRFYPRTSAGKYPLDVREIRAAFALSEAIGERVRRFRDERVGRILAQETPVKIEPGPNMILHIVPISSLESSGNVDVSSFEAKRDLFLPLSGNMSGSRYNFDGFLTFHGGQQPKPYFSYLQVYRTGALEAVITRGFHADEKSKYIPSISFEERLITSVTRYLKLLYEMGSGLPVFVMITLTGVKGYIMGVDTTRFDLDEEDVHSIDRDHLFLPELIVEDLKAEPETLLRPAFDSLWQAAGWDRSRNYNEEGKWIGKRW